MPDTTPSTPEINLRDALVAIQAGSGETNRCFAARISISRSMWLTIKREPALIGMGTLRGVIGADLGLSWLVFDLMMARTGIVIAPARAAT